MTVTRPRAVAETTKALNSLDYCPPKARAQLSVTMRRKTSRHAAHTFVALLVAVLGALACRLAASAGAESVLAVIDQREDQDHKDG